MNSIEIKPLEFFLMNNQPFTCPYCGTRSKTLADFYHTNSNRLVQQCLNIVCGFICYEEEDEYYLKLWKAK